MKILIADDDKVTRRLVRSMLDQHADVHEAIDGGEVIANVNQAWEENAPFQCLILDIGMPVCDGLDALIAIRNMEDDRGIRNQDRMRIIILTGSEAPGDIYDAHMLDSTAYLMKPIDRTRLLRALEHAGAISEELNEP